MLLGNKVKFAIEVEYSIFTDEWVYGTYFFWINNLRFGNPEDSVALNACYNEARYFIEYPQSFINENYYNMNQQELLDAIGDYSNINSEDTRYYIDYLGLSSFDRYRDYFIFVKNKDEEERIVWNSILNGVGNIYLGKQEFETILQEFVFGYESELSKQLKD